MIYLVIDVVFAVMAVASIVYLAWPQPQPDPTEHHHLDSGPTNDYQVFAEEKR